MLYVGKGGSSDPPFSFVGAVSKAAAKFQSLRCEIPRPVRQLYLFRVERAYLQMVLTVHISPFGVLTQVFLR